MKWVEYFSLVDKRVHACVCSHIWEFCSLMPSLVMTAICTKSEICICVINLKSLITQNLVLKMCEITFSMKHVFLCFFFLLFFLFGFFFFLFLLLNNIYTFHTTCISLEVGLKTDFWLIQAWRFSSVPSFWS